MWPRAALVGPGWFDERRDISSYRELRRRDPDRRGDTDDRIPRRSAGRSLGRSATQGRARIGEERREAGEGPAILRLVVEERDLHL